MDCLYCRQKFKHSHLTKEDEKFISNLFQEAEQKIPIPFYSNIDEREKKMSDRKNEIIWWVNEELIRLGKRVRFPRPKYNYPYDEYIN